jgi:multiple sugar transport system substrate-binding protein
MKRAIALLGVTLVCMSFFALPAYSEGAAGKSKPVRITFWNGYTGPDGEILTDYVDKFNKTNPYGITVDMDINAQFLTKIAAAFAGGKAPDMVLGPSSFKDQYPNYLIDMNELFRATSLKKSDWVGGYMDVCSGGDKLFVVPLQITGRFMYWNKDLFKAAGLDPEKGPSSYEEWAKWAAKITNKDKNIYGSGVPFNSIFNTVHLLQRMGGLFVDYDANHTLVPRFKNNKGYAHFLTWYSGMVKSGDNPLETDMDSMMKAGQLGITLSGAFLSTGLDAAGINYGVSQLPEGEAGPQNPCSVGGLSITSSASEEARIAAFRFIEWWFSGDAKTTPSGILNWSLANGYPSCYKPAINDKRYQSSKKLAAMTNNNPKAVTTYLAPKEFNKTFQLANEVIESMIESVVSNRKDASKALDDAQAKAAELLK